MKIKHSIFCLLLFFTLIPVIVLSFFSIHEANQKIEKLTRENLQAVSTNQITNIQNFCEDRKDEMSIIGSYRIVEDAVLSSLRGGSYPTNRHYIDNLLKKRMTYNSFVASISIMDKNFRVVNSSESYKTKEISHLKYIAPRFRTGDFILGNAYERETNDGKKKLVPAYIGIFKHDELIGYVVEELDTEYFDKLRLNMDSLSQSTFYLLDGDDTIITAGSTQDKKSISKFKSSPKDRENFQEKWDSINHQKHPTGQVRYRYKGENYITYYSNVKYSDWKIRISENLTAQKNLSNSYRSFILLFLCFLILGIFVTESLLMRKLLHPITCILNTFEQIQEKQDYSLRIPIKSKDEMEELSAGINELLKHVEDAHLQAKNYQNHLKDLAKADPLTGIKNKKAVEQAIDAMIKQATKDHEQITVGFLDIDDFRNYNTKYGHQEGDLVIQFVANTLSEELSGCVGRNGGDEFIFCHTGVLTYKEIEKTMELLLHRLNQKYVSKQTHAVFPIPCSIGIVTSHHSLPYSDFIQMADKAMYEAKKAGKNTFYILEI